jgi:hypothetical protein
MKLKELQSKVSQPGQKVQETLSQTGGVVQVVQYLSSEHESLRWNPSITKKEKERKNETL